MSYRISGLPRDRFAHLFGLSDDALAAYGAVRMTATAKPGYPCRVTLEAAEPGENLLLLNYEHLPEETPYRSRHAIFVREGAGDAAEFTGAVPEQLAIRLLSVRAYDAQHMMTDADVVEGAELEPLIARFLADPAVDYLHVHNARRGCFAARVDRA
ncbi:DUF1203 domain-containing protein [Sphingomonas sp. G-3-2-10]|uniref:DUF1203 domain-containing protein n=1 Tax=Sphingomonas sp. G-3-2-10 TaxID=2728838 RepID=UPI00146AC543|nr:DUF1203 domain-containing protein [Sphingomonas sp. G-3-2-10]NML07476.1 DUF1203 domain-containing protein [Sphingomonas sp. G-3-2-10]